MSHNRDKHPDIWPLFESAKNELDELKAKRAEFTDQINEKQLKIDALKSDQAELNTLAMADYDRIRELSTKVKHLSQMMGGKTVSSA